MPQLQWIPYEKQNPLAEMINSFTGGFALGAGISGWMPGQGGDAGKKMLGGGGEKMGGGDNGLSSLIQRLFSRGQGQPQSQQPQQQMQQPQQMGMQGQGMPMSAGQPQQQGASPVLQALLQRMRGGGLGNIGSMSSGGGGRGIFG